MQKSSKFIIAEDDIIFNNDYSFKDNRTILENLYINIEKYNYEMYYLEYCNDSCIFQYNKDKNITKLYEPLCTAFILYNINNYSKWEQLCNNKYIIQNINNFTIKYLYGVDNYLSNIIKKNIVTAYGTDYFIQYPEFFNSSLDGSATNVSQKFLFNNLLSNSRCNEIFLTKIIIFCIITIVLSIIFIYFLYKIVIWKILN